MPTLVGRIGNVTVWIVYDEVCDEYKVKLQDTEAYNFTIAESQALATLLENIHKIRWKSQIRNKFG